MRIDCAEPPPRPSSVPICVHVLPPAESVMLENVPIYQSIATITRSPAAAVPSDPVVAVGPPEAPWLPAARDAIVAPPPTGAAIGLFQMIVAGPGGLPGVGGSTVADTAGDHGPSPAALIERTRQEAVPSGTVTRQVRVVSVGAENATHGISTPSRSSTASVTAPWSASTSHTATTSRVACAESVGASSSAHSATHRRMGHSAGGGMTAMIVPAPGAMPTTTV